MKLSKEQKRAGALAIADAVRDGLAKKTGKRELKKLARRAGSAIKAGIEVLNGGR